MGRFVLKAKTVSELLADLTSQISKLITGTHSHSALTALKNAIQVIQAVSEAGLIEKDFMSYRELLPVLLAKTPDYLSTCSFDFKLDLYNSNRPVWEREFAPCRITNDAFFAQLVSPIDPADSPSFRSFSHVFYAGCTEFCFHYLDLMDPEKPKIGLTAVADVLIDMRLCGFSLGELLEEETIGDGSEPIPFVLEPPKTSACALPPGGSPGRPESKSVEPPSADIPAEKVVLFGSSKRQFVPGLLPLALGS